MLGLLSFLSLLVAAAGAFGAYAGFLGAEMGAYLAAGGVAAMSFFWLIAFLFVVANKKTSWITFLLGLPAVAALAYYGFFRFEAKVPDVSTDLLSPPKFQHPAYPFALDRGGEYLDASLQLPRPYDESLAAEQTRTAPNLENVKVKAPGPDSYGAVLKVVREQFPGWTLVLEDAKKLRLELTESRLPFRLLDDIVLEVRSDPRMPNESEVAVRCRPRLADADLGHCLALVDDLRLRLSIALKSLQADLEHKAAMTPPPDLAAPTSTATGTGTSTSTATSSVTTTAGGTAAQPAPAAPPAKGPPVPGKNPPPARPGKPAAGEKKKK